MPTFARMHIRLLFLCVNHGCKPTTIIGNGVVSTSGQRIGRSKKRHSLLIARVGMPCGGDAIRKNPILHLIGFHAPRHSETPSERQSAEHVSRVIARAGRNCPEGVSIWRALACVAYQRRGNNGYLDPSRLSTQHNRGCCAVGVRSIFEVLTEHVSHIDKGCS
jgi:hypothetical protein